MIPVLPDEIAEKFDDATPACDAASDAEVDAFVAKHTDASRPEVLAGWVKALENHFAAHVSRHGSTVSVLVGAMKERIHERDGGMCQLGLPGCTVYSEAVDHIIPISVTGLSREYDDDANLRAVCNHCHHIVTEQHRIARVKEAAAHRYARRHLPVSKHPGDP